MVSPVLEKNEFGTGVANMNDFIASRVMGDVGDRHSVARLG